MKEYFQKIVAWAKAHPWLAAGILGGIVVLVWLAIRNGWFGGGGGGGEASAVVPPGGGGEAALPDLSNLPDTSALPPGVNQIGQSSEPIPVSLPSVPTQGYDMAGAYPSGAESFGALPSYPADTGYSIGAPVNSIQGQALQGQSLAEVSAPSPSASLGAKPGANFFMGSLSYNTAQELPSQIISSGPVPTATSAPPPSTSLLDQLLAPIDLRPKKGKAPNAQKPNANLNPAQQKGKGKNFTGYIDGVYYNKGFPAASSSAAAQTKLAPSAGSMVSPALGGGFFTGQYLDPTVNRSTTKPAASKSIKPKAR